LSFVLFSLGHCIVCLLVCFLLALGTHDKTISVLLKHVPRLSRLLVSIHYPYPRLL
jgi:hypothetical protein